MRRIHSTTAHVRKVLSLAIAAGFALPAAANASYHPPTSTPAHGHEQLPHFETNVNWPEFESPVLTNHVQLTFPDRFEKAGEAYFSHDGKRIIFQAIPVHPEGGEEEEHYQMYVAELAFNRAGDITGLARIARLSPEGSYNTCGWFHPDGKRVAFASTVKPPASPEAAGFQREGSTYSWFFPEETEIIVTDDPFAPGAKAKLGDPITPANAYTITTPLTPLFERDGYDAEGSYTRDGRWYLYANVDPDADEKLSADLWVFDTKTNKQIPLVNEPGYDGGPFFSPDETRICYRSDRDDNDLLQLYVTDLIRNDRGEITGAKERRLTNNRHVNWAPFFHPSGKFLIYTTSEQGHFNYEIYAVETDPAPGAEPRKMRVTHAGGFDGLSVFDLTGTYMMWTSQRGEGGSSQLWLANAQPAFDLQDWKKTEAPDAPLR